MLVKPETRGFSTGDALGIFAITLVILSGVWLFNGPMSGSSYQPVTENPPPAWPSVEIDYNQSTPPDWLYVYVTNNADRSYHTGYSSFRVHDADGVVYENDLTSSYWSGDGFPSFIEIFPGEKVKGYLVFETDRENPPFDLTYEHPWGRLQVNLTSQA